jgi:hypothetical protein
MILYHGTSERHVERILKEGLRSRKYTKMRSNFDKHPSHTEMVYLSNCYAPYFAANASKDGRWAIIEVNVDEENLLPDEDFMEQASRGTHRIQTLSLEERTAEFKEDLQAYAEHALDSLKHLGTVAHDGMIRDTEIERIALFDHSKNMYMAMMALDPTISLLNHKILGKHYENVTRWFFESVEPEDLHQMSWIMFDADQRQVMADKVNNREGLELTWVTAKTSNSLL